MKLLNSKKKDPSKNSTQQYIDVEKIKDGVIVLKNNSLRSILMVSSINFGLKSSDEQDAIIMEYQNFLNSLDFPIQIFISSKKLNVDSYLGQLEEKEKLQENNLLRAQTREYKNFIKELTEMSQIMSKFFYIVVPFYPVENKEGGFLDKVSSIVNPRQTIIEEGEFFESYKNQLWQRVDQITVGLSRIGVDVTPLNTEEIIELLYNSYNPSMFTSSVIKHTNEIEMQS